MPVRVLLAVAVVLFICLLFAADQALKAIRRARRRREADRRLSAVTAAAQARDRHKKAAAEASGALTSIMPTIHDLETRHVE